MSIEYCVICDCCGAVLDGSKRGAYEVRKAVREQLGAHINRPGGRDICAECWARGNR